MSPASPAIRSRWWVSRSAKSLSVGDCEALLDQLVEPVQCTRAVGFGGAKQGQLFPPPPSDSSLLLKER